MYVVFHQNMSIFVYLAWKLDKTYYHFLKSCMIYLDPGSYHRKQPWGCWMYWSQIWHIGRIVHFSRGGFIYTFSPSVSSSFTFQCIKFNSTSIWNLKWLNITSSLSQDAKLALHLILMPWNLRIVHIGSILQSDSKFLTTKFCQLVQIFKFLGLNSTMRSYVHFICPHRTDCVSVGPKTEGLQPKILDLRLQLWRLKFEEIPTAVPNFLTNFSFLVFFPKWKLR